MFDIKGVAQEYMASAKTAFSHDRSKTVGASEIFACARRIGYKKKLGAAGYDKEYVETLGMAERGNILEDHFSVPLVEYALTKSYGDLPEDKRPKLLWAGQSGQTTLVADGVPLSATPDGLIVNAPKDILKGYGVADIEGNALLVEFKSHDPRMSEKKMPKDQHIGQVNAQLGLVRKLAGKSKTEPKPSYAIIIYVNASDLGDIKVFPHKYDDGMFRAQLDRAKMMMTADPELLRPEGKILGDGQCRYCEYSSRCFGYSLLVPREARNVSPKVLGSLRKMAKAVEEAKEKAKEYEQEAEAIKSTIKETLAAEQTKYVRASDFVLGWKQTPGRGGYNYDAMKAELVKLGGDPEEFKKEGKPGDQLDVEVF